MAYPVIRLDNMAGTTDGRKLKSVVFNDGTDDAAIGNGLLVAIGALLSDERELHEAVAPAANTPIGKLAIIATPELMYDAKKKNLVDFVNEAGVPARAYVLTADDEFGVTADALSAVPTVGSIIEAQADTKMNVVATLTAGSTQIGTVIAIEIVNSLTFYVIHVD